MNTRVTLTALTLAAVTAATVSTGVQAQQRPMGPPPGPMGMMAPFAAIDTNKDGSLSADEIKAFEASRVAGLDANNDGFLTADEIGAQMTKLATEAMTERATRMIDHMGGKDGKISLADLEAKPMPGQRFVDRMLKVGGGKITKEAFAAMQVRLAAQMDEGPDAGRMGDHHRKHMGNRMGDQMGGQGRMADNGARGGDQSGPMTGPKNGQHRRDHGPMQGGQGHGGHGDRMGGDRMGGGMMGSRDMMAGVSFDQLDTNHDGVITADEVKAFREAQIAALDTNKDGFISADEFVAARMAKMAPKIQAHAAEMVKALDLNGDGKIDITELAAAPMAMMFAHLPTAPDGSITKAAYEQAMHPHWPGDWRHAGKQHHRPGKARAGAPVAPGADGTAPAASGN